MSDGSCGGLDLDCDAPSEEGQLLTTGGELLLPESTQGLAGMDFSPSGKLYVLDVTGLWRYDGAWQQLTDQPGELPYYVITTAFEVYDDEHVYWSEGGGIREWTTTGIRDHFVDHASSLLSVLVDGPTDIWAVGYDDALLHEQDGVVESIDLLSMIDPRPADATLQLWDIERVGDAITVVGVGGGTFGTLEGAVGVLGVRRQDQWSVQAFDTAPGYAFVNYSAPTCTGELVVGGDYALIGHVNLDSEFTYLAGGTLAQDFLVSNVVETCGGKTWVGIGAPGMSAIVEVGLEPPSIANLDDQVPGFLNVAACYRGVLYYNDSWAADDRIVRYR